jgi:uncharacterized protein (TIGR02996 family)
MTDGEALMRAILEAPDDDAPRLVFADWLQENGRDGAATYIRFAVANREGVWLPLGTAALHGPHPLAGHPKKWTRDPTNGRAEVSRGFIRSIELEPAHFLRIAAELFETEPITRVQLTGTYPERVFWAGTWGWNSDAARPVPRSHVLPKVLYDSLDLTTGPRWPSVEDAERQLSRACVRYGRRLAGLSPLDAV